MGDKDRLIVAMFLAASCALSSGCSSDHAHIDKDKDGYCDECNAKMNRSSTGSRYYGLFNSGSTTSSSSSISSSSSDGHISTGVAAGGIGSHATGGGG